MAVVVVPKAEPPVVVPGTSNWFVGTGAPHEVIAPYKTWNLNSAGRTSIGPIN